MSKIQIIDVDLGIDIDKIILNCSRSLTKEAREQLDGALAAHIEAKQLKDNKVAAKKEATSGISTVLAKAFDDLKAAGPKGVLSETIIQDVSKFISTPSAFSLRMSTYLSSLGNPYRLIRKKINGESHYIFVNFNASPDQDL